MRVQAYALPEMTMRNAPCDGWDDSSLLRLYGIFREKMHDIYRKNYMPNPFSEAMSAEYNAWQYYLRNSLSLEVRDASANQKSEVLREEGSECRVRVLNPSNGTSFGHEYIVVPEELARKVIVMGGLPDEL